MTNFIEIPASKLSLSARRTVCGIGINDADYIVFPSINGKKTMCPYYQSWKDMLNRCYCPKLQKRQSTYVGCSVVKEWLTFSVFREWMKKQEWKDKELDKDILIPGNKLYSPNTCIFVSRQINSLLNDNAAIRGEYPQGVCFNSNAGKYAAYCRANGKRKHLGYFISIPEAENAYLTFKSELIRKIAREEEASNNQRLKFALLRHADIFKRIHIRHTQRNKRAQKDGKRSC